MPLAAVLAPLEQKETEHAEFITFFVLSVPSSSTHPTHAAVQDAEHYPTTSDSPTRTKSPPILSGNLSQNPNFG